MKQESQSCVKDRDNQNQIEYSCFYRKCKFFSCLCQYCKSDVNHQHKTHIVNKEEYQQQQQIMKQSIINAKFEIYEYGNQIKGFVGAISNDLKYVAIGGRDLNIFDHSNNNLIKTIKFNIRILYVKFTDDSKILYVMTFDLTLYKFNVNKQFKEVNTYQGYDKNYDFIRNIYNISNEIILTSSAYGNIRKIHVQQKKQMQNIKAHSDQIPGLDFNKSLNIIASGSSDKSIALWNANNGQLLMRKQFAHGKASIREVLFMINDQLISQDTYQLVIIWKIDYKTKRLYKQQTLNTFNENIQLVLHQQFIISTGVLTVQIYSIDGELIRKFDHNLYKTCKIKYYNYNFFNLDGYKLIQPDSMQSCLLFGQSDSENKQLVFKIKFD